MTTPAAASHLQAMLCNPACNSHPDQPFSWLLIRSKMAPSKQPTIRNALPVFLTATRDVSMDSVFSIDRSLVKLKLLHMAGFLFYRFLFIFVQTIIAHDKVIHACVHETLIGFLRTADDRLSSHIE